MYCWVRYQTVKLWWTLGLTTTFHVEVIHISFEAKGETLENLRTWAEELEGLDKEKEFSLTILSLPLYALTKTKVPVKELEEAKGHMEALILRPSPLVQVHMQ